MPVGEWMQDPADVDALKSQSLDGDANPANLTAYQAQKCAAILEAYLDGQTLYREQINTVAQFLKAAAVEGALGGSGYYRPASSTLWQDLDALSWPRSGGPQSQAD